MVVLDPKVAPSLQRQQHELERHLLQDALEHKIQERPEPSQLIEQGILTGNTHTHTQINAKKKKFLTKKLFLFLLLEEEVPK